MSERGLIHIYCGDGKGKTTAALGLGLRAWGNGIQVLFLPFLKDARSGEIAAIKNLDGFCVAEVPEHLPFLRDMTSWERLRYTEFAGQMFEEGVEAARKGQCGLLILDELCAAVNQGILSLDKVTESLETKPPDLEVVLTGRNPPEQWISLADYVSEIHCIKHPYQKGIPARQGIEY